MAQGQSAAMSSAAQIAMPSEFGRKWEEEYLNTELPLSNLLHAGYSVKLKINNMKYEEVYLYKIILHTFFKLSILVMPSDKEQITVSRNIT